MGWIAVVRGEYRGSRGKAGCIANGRHCGRNLLRSHARRAEFEIDVRVANVDPGVAPSRVVSRMPLGILGMDTEGHIRGIDVRMNFTAELSHSTDHHPIIVHRGGVLA